MTLFVQINYINIICAFIFFIFIFVINSYYAYKIIERMNERYLILGNKFHYTNILDLCIKNFELISFFFRKKKKNTDITIDIADNDNDDDVKEMNIFFFLFLFLEE